MNSAGKFLILLALCAGFQIPPAHAARKCPSGQILRVSLGICVAKEQNLSVLQQHARKPAKRVDNDLATPASEQPAPNESADLVALAPRHAADRQTSAAAEKPDAAPASQPASSPLSPFGQLFVGAFHSTVSAGLSAFR